MNRLLTILFLLISSIPQAQPFNLVKEINTTASENSIASTLMARVGSTMYFTANDGNAGNELWKSDGTAAGTVMVKDIAPGSASTLFASFTTGDGLLFFVANDGIHGYELWRSDGTEAGTFMLRDGFSECTFCLNRMIFHNGYLYFAGNDGTTGAELWKTDGSVAGTVLVKDIFPGLPESHPAPTSNANYTFVTMGNELFFTAVDPNGGRELFKTDGTAAGTVMIKDILPGAGSGISTVNHKAAVFNGKVFFAANDGINGVELWATDGSDAGTYRVTDIAPGSGFSNPNNLIVFNGALYFTASTTNTGNPNLYKTDGTAAGTVLVRDLVADGLLLSIGNSAAINDFTVAGSKLFFRIINGPLGTELYATDGTTAGTGLVKEMLPGVNGGLILFYSVFNDKLIFSSTDWELPSRGAIIYQSDGTAAGTTPLLGGEAGDLIYNPFTPKDVVNGRLYFWSNTIDYGQELWSTDGTIAGTYLVKDINTRRTGTQNSHRIFQGSVIKDGIYYFAAADDDHGYELWKSDGTASGTSMVKDIWVGKGSSNPFQFYLHGNFIYFTAGDNVHGVELWRTDGTENGTVMVADIFPGELSSSPNRFLSSDNYIYFTAYHPSYGTELWRSDGTAGGTTIVLDAVPGAANGIVAPQDAAVQGNNSYYLASMQSGNTLGIPSGTKLLRVDGATNTISEMSSSIASASDMGVVGNTVYVIGRNTANQTVLWKTENGGAVTQVRVINPTFISTLFQLTACNGKLYFNAATTTYGAEPWVSDGTEGGTYMIKDINPGTNNSVPFQFVYSGGKVFFSAGSSGSGTSPLSLDTELWVTDDTEPGTYRVKDIFPGPTGSRPGGTTAVPGNKVLFVANDGTTGVELWESDGTEAGTRLVQDFNTAGDGFIPPAISLFQPADYFFNQIGSSTIFFARSADKGAQLYIGRIPASYYVNDNSTTGDVFTTATGNDANPGTSSAPFATLTHALSVAVEGSSIYVDAGSYVTPDFTIDKPVTIRGANYLIKPNDLTDPLQPNQGRNAETTISNCLMTIAASDITLEGLTFEPLTKTAIRQIVASTGFDNISIRNNRFLVNSGNPVINMTGKQQLPLTTVNYTISGNRFIKFDGSNGTNIRIQAVNGILVSENTFTSDNASADLKQNDYNGGFRSDNVVITANHAYRQQHMIQSPVALRTTISFNKALECVRFALDFNSIASPSEIDISDNEVTFSGNGSFGPMISYARSNGIDLSAPNIARIQRNKITVNATGFTQIPQTLIAPSLDNASLNTEVYIRENTLKITGDFSTLSFAHSYVSGIRFLNNSRKAYVEDNELEFTATNYSSTNKFGIGIVHAGIQADASFNFNNNKISGFPTSVGIQNTVGVYGSLPTGVTLNINNNSFTGDLMSVNNGTTGQPANAHCNWYGSSAAQDIINKITLSTVDVVPWLTSGTDNDPATGFQPVPGACDGYPPLIVLDSYTNVTCNGANNGSISITASYGKAPFAFTWTKAGDPQFISHEEDPTGLAPGDYHLSVVDGNGSTIYITDINAESPGSIDVTITEPSLLTATASGTNNPCFGNSAGTASVEASGGTAPYTYLWSNGATTSEITNLVAGLYSATVTDANGCTAQASYEVTQPSLLTAAITNNSTACANIATVATNGGTPAYSFLWSNGATSATISNVPAGTYNVVVTDANGCTVSASVILTVSEAFNPSASVTNVSCFGGSNGVITVTNANGTAPFSFSIDGINFQPGTLPYSFTGLAAGTYNIAVRDVNGCTGFVSKTVGQPSELIITLNSVQTACYGISNGAISITISGGSPAFSYQWTGPGGYTSTQASISNLAAGQYILTVTDSKGCIKMLEVTVPTFNEVVIAATVTNVACKGDATGAIDLTVSGGSGSGFSYQWLNGPATEDRSNLPYGNYTVDITDLGSGCVLRRIYLVNQPASLLKLNNPTVTPVSGCEISELGSISASASNGVQPYQFKLNNGAYQASGVFTGLAAGNYTVWVKDNYGCEKSVTVSVEDNGSDQYERVNSPNNNTKNRAVPVSLGQIIGARLSENDQDWYRFTTPAGANSEFVMTLTHPDESFTFNMYPGGNNATAMTPVSVTAVSKTYILAGNTTYFMNVAGDSSLVCYNLSVDHNIQTRTMPSIYTKEGAARETDHSVAKLSAQVYPSPHNGRFTLRINSPVEGPAVIQLWGADGRLVSSRNILLQKGTNNTINFNNRREAVLFYRILKDKESATGKILGPN